jgi:hypothetical protein
VADFVTGDAESFCFLTRNLHRQSFIAIWKYMNSTIFSNCGN